MNKYTFSFKSVTRGLLAITLRIVLFPFALIHITHMNFEDYLYNTRVFPKRKFYPSR